MDYTTLRTALVDYLEDRRYLFDQRVKQALLKVERHRYVDTSPLEAYSDQALSLKEENDQVISTISQPSIVCHMLEELFVQEGNRVLEIGTGSGYNAALLAELVGEGEVISVEYDRELALKARKNLQGYKNVSVVHGDGRDGYAPGGHYDRIVATVKAADVYIPWQKQLKEQGILLAPLEYACGFTRLVRLEKTNHGFSGHFGVAVRFVSMPGEDCEENFDVETVKSQVLGKNLIQEEAEAFVFFHLCSGLAPDAAMDAWLKLGRPGPADFLLETTMKNVKFKLKFPSMELGMSLVNSIT